MSRRLTALVIGNAAYEHAGVLTNPTNDAEDIAAKFAGCGFSVSKAIDGSDLELGRALKRFKKTLGGWWLCCNLMGLDLLASAV